MRLIGADEKFVHDMGYPIVLISEHEKWSWKHGDSLITYRRVPATVRKEALLNHPNDVSQQRNFMFVYAIINWENVQDSNGNLLEYEPIYVPATPSDFRIPFFQLLSEACPQEFDADRPSSKLTYRRLTASEQADIVENSSEMGSVNVTNFLFEKQVRAILDWENVYDFSGQLVEHSRKLVEMLPDQSQAKVLDLIDSSNPIGAEIKNSNGSLRSITLSADSPAVSVVNS